MLNSLNIFVHKLYPHFVLFRILGMSVLKALDLSGQIAFHFHQMGTQ